MALEKQWTAWNFTKCKKSIHTAGKRICTVKERDCLGCTVQEMFKESFGKINDFVTVEWCHLGPGRARASLVRMIGAWHGHTLMSFKNRVETSFEG